MQHLNKLLMRISQNEKLFKEPDLNFILGLTSTQIKELKKYALSNDFIFGEKHNFYLTSKGEEYLKNNEIEKWSNETYFKRPEINLEYLKIEKTPPAVTKAIRNLPKKVPNGALLYVLIHVSLLPSVKNDKKYANGISKINKMQFIQKVA